MARSGVPGGEGGTMRVARAAALVLYEATGQRQGKEFNQ
jgi:hypothetical protein